MNARTYHLTLQCPGAARGERVGEADTAHEAHVQARAVMNDAPTPSVMRMWSIARDGFRDLAFVYVRTAEGEVYGMTRTRVCYSNSLTAQHIRATAGAVLGERHWLARYWPPK